LFVVLRPNEKATRATRAAFFKGE